MKNVFQTFGYSIGKKMLMGLSGLFLISFLVVHLLGNLQLLKSDPQPFNDYAEFMGHNPLIRTMEIVLFLGFALHIADGLRLAAQNRKARPMRYAVSAGSKNSSFSSRFMVSGGIIMLIFLLLHLISFFFLSRFSLDIGLGFDPSVWTGPQFGEEGHSLYHKTIRMLGEPWYCAIYVLAMIPVALHLHHGFQSAFQTLGFNHKKYSPFIKMLGTGFAILVPLAYAFICVWVVVCRYACDFYPAGLFN
jgi:succinate dehydrogenase / fumarate reductase cytochrome b subunit